MILGKPVELHRDLRNAVKYACELQSRAFYCVLAVPHDHIRMHRGFARGKSEVGDALSVEDRVVRAVAHAEHIAVFSDRGSDVGLSELDEDLGVELAESVGHLRHKSINGILERVIIAPFVVFKRASLEGKSVDKIELEPVKSPFADCFGVNADKVLAHLAVSRVEGEVRSAVSALIEEHIVEAVVYLRFDARVGNRKQTKA